MLFGAIDLLSRTTVGLLIRMVDPAHSVKKATTTASRFASDGLLAAQPDAVGTATRLAVPRLRQARIADRAGRLARWLRGVSAFTNACKR